MARRSRGWSDVVVVQEVSGSWKAQVSLLDLQYGTLTLDVSTQEMFLGYVCTKASN